MSGAPVRFEHQVRTSLYLSSKPDADSRCQDVPASRQFARRPITDPYLRVTVRVTKRFEIDRPPGFKTGDGEVSASRYLVRRNERGMSYSETPWPRGGVKPWRCGRIQWTRRTSTSGPGNSSRRWDMSATRAKAGLALE